VSTLPTGVAVLLGNDLCPHPSTIDVNFVTRSQTAALRNPMEITSTCIDTSSDDTLAVDTEPTNEMDSDPVTDISKLFGDTGPQSLFELVDREELIRLQQTDPDIASLFELVDQPEYGYVISAGVLVRLWRDKCSPQEDAIKQIVVPTTLRAKLLHLAHEIPAAGHFGVSKTKDRLLRHFYWPSISRDTRGFCRSCDVCQRIGKGAPCLPAPLHSLPLLSEPFSQVAVDIVGPLPVCKDTGNRFMLTVL